MLNEMVPNNDYYLFIDRIRIAISLYPSPRCAVSPKAKLFNINHLNARHLDTYNQSRYLTNSLDLFPTHFLWLISTKPNQIKPTIPNNFLSKLTNPLSHWAINHCDHLPPTGRPSKHTYFLSTSASASTITTSEPSTERMFFKLMLDQPILNKHSHSPFRQHKTRDKHEIDRMTMTMVSIGQF